MSRCLFVEWPNTIPQPVNWGFSTLCIFFFYGFSIPNENNKKCIFISFFQPTTKKENKIKRKTNKKSPKRCMEKEREEEKIIQTFSRLENSTQKDDVYKANTPNKLKLWNIETLEVKNKGRKKKKINKIYRFSSSSFILFLFFIIHFKYLASFLLHALHFRKNFTVTMVEHGWGIWINVQQQQDLQNVK